MNNIFNKITGAINHSLRFLFFAIVFNSFILAQTVSNLKQFYSVIDSASSLLLIDLGNTKEVKLDLSLGKFYSVLGNQVRNNLLKNGIKLNDDSSSDINQVTVNFVIDNCNVVYSQPERDGLLGDFYTERNIGVSGNYFISKNQAIKNFDIVKKDTVQIKDVEEIEDNSYPFTQGDIPAETFFSSILEPVVAISAAAITIILFFSVRSK
jgi:hypothetical protein